RGSREAGRQHPRRGERAARSDADGPRPRRRVPAHDLPRPARKRQTSLRGRRRHHRPSDRRDESDRAGRDRGSPARGMTLLLKPVPPARHLLRAKDLIDARYREQLDVPTLARAAHLSPAHFAREFRRAFGETPHRYLVTRRLERAAALLRSTDRPVADVCLAVGLRSVGSFTTSFGRAFGLSPTAYRATQPP